MDRSGRYSATPSRGFPRTRGDGPFGKADMVIPPAFPPHARGWTAGEQTVQPLAGVSPARAGMDRRGGGCSATASGFPRTRGDGPSVQEGLGTLVPFPPHARGWTRVGRLVRKPDTVSPARAGMDPVVATEIPRMKRFPRTRGDGPFGWECLPQRPTFPPHVPRTRGDGPVSATRLLPRQPFPPHARGWTAVPVPVVAPDEVSPARAGMDPRPETRPWRSLQGRVSPARAGMDP